jgi:peptide/nickel transport system substrate-binding protein
LPGVLCDPRFTVIDTSVKDRDIPQRGPVCTGPYTITSFAGDKAVLEANPHYWDGPVPFKGLELPVLADPHTRAMALKKGQVDAALDIASGDLTLFQDANTFRVSETESVSSVLSLLNVKPGKPLADKRIRDALIFCLDRPAYCKTLLKGTFIPGGPVLAPGLGYGYDTLMQSYGSRQDVGKSKKLLAEAGWKDTNRDGFVDKDGKTLEIGFTICTDRAELPLFAEAVKLDAKNVGIKVNIKTADRNALEQARKTGDYDMLIHSGMTTLAGSPLHYLDRNWKSDTNGSNPQNTSGYRNAAFDALSDALAAEADPAKQKQMLLDMQKILLEDTAVIVFGYPKTNIVSRTGMIHADVNPCDDYRITKDWKRKE